MTKVRKQKRKKTFRYNVNRKRTRNKLKRGVSIGCKEIKTEWDTTKSVQKNLEEMGLAYDPNKVVENNSKSQESMDTDKPAKSFVAKSLEADANAPRVKLFRLPNGQCEWLTNMIKKYGEDFKAMSRDKNNHDQLTWKQLRAKIKTFKGIPEQYELYMGSPS